MRGPGRRPPPAGGTARPTPGATWPAGRAPPVARAVRLCAPIHSPRRRGRLAAPARAVWSAPGLHQPHQRRTPPRRQTRRRARTARGWPLRCAPIDRREAATRAGQAGWWSAATAAPPLQRPIDGVASSTFLVLPSARRHAITQETRSSPTLLIGSTNCVRDSEKPIINENCDTGVIAQ